MLEVAPKSILSSTLLIFEGERHRGHVRAPFLAPHSLRSTVFLLDGRCYKPSPHPAPKAHKRVFQDLRFPWHAESALFLDNEPVAHAKRQRVSLGGRLPVSTYLVQCESSTFRLAPKLAGGAARFGVSEKSAHTKHEEHEIGSIVVPGWLATRTVIDLPERLPLFLQVYLFWLSRSMRDLSQQV